MSDLDSQIARMLGSAVEQSRTLSGGCVADVRRVILSDGRDIVAKRGNGLVLEARMLGYLADHSRLPVPKVLAVEDDLLLMSYIQGGDDIDARVEEDAAEHLAALHSLTAPTFGMVFDTVIGGLAQPNARHRSWRVFFRDRRLMHMADEAHNSKRLPTALYTRLTKLAGHLDKWITDDAEPGLVHGDLWSGNILVRGGKIAGVIDPAISYSDPEIELAFTTLFNTFGKAFFARYHSLRPIAPGFFEERRDLYNLYPLLVHVRLFGGSYVNDVDKIVTRFGY